MKINIELDISPEEVRRLYGLPDLSNIHQTLSSTISDSLNKGDDKAIKQLLTPLISTGMNSLDSYQKLLGALFTMGSTKKTTTESGEH